MHWTLIALLASLAIARADIALKLARFDGPSASVIAPEGGILEIRGPNSILATPAAAVGKGSWVLEMEYFCAGGVPTFAVLSGPPFVSNEARYLPALGHSETWSRYAARLNPPARPLSAGWRELRLDLPLEPDRVLQIRNARLRLELPGEFDAKATASANAADAAVLDAYLSKSSTGEISRVVVGASQITLTGKVAGSTADLFAADIPMEFILGKGKRYESLIPIKTDPTGAFTVSFPRLAIRDGREYDRLTSRWQLIRHGGSGDESIGHARYADDVACRDPKLPPVKLRSKKGLGDWSANRLPGELEELGISAVTVNIDLNQFTSLTQMPGTTPFKWQGRTYYAKEQALTRYDKTFVEAQKHGVMVSAILLIKNPAGSTDPQVKLLGHPDAVKEGAYAMPNVTSPDGIAYYGAILNLLAERWSKNDGVHGRVHHWIIHNEVDAGWVWTNAGIKEDIVYLDLYQRSMRLVNLITRQYDPNARPFITLTHHWAEAGNKNWYGSKRMIELLLRFCQAEGDFPWAMAYHPYPQNLLNPRTWEDDQATFDFNTKKITPKNLEVLDAYMKLPELLYQGEVRPVHFSENGFNSKGYSDKALEDQAAGMALAWKKMAALSSIEQWQYHNWIDNRNEGGLQIGLRKFPDEKTDPLGKKPIWYLYKALGTPQEDAVAAPYLKTMGISSWNDVLYRGEIR